MQQIKSIERIEPDEHCKNMQINFSGETIEAVDLKPDYDPYRVRLNLALPVFRLNT